MTLKLSEIESRMRHLKLDASSVVQRHFEMDHQRVFGDRELCCLAKNYSTWRKVWTESLKRAH